MGHGISAAYGRVFSPTQVIRSCAGNALHQIKKLGAGIGSLVTSIRQAGQPAAARVNEGPVSGGNAPTQFKCGKLLVGIQQKVDETRDIMLQASKDMNSLEKERGDLKQKKDLLIKLFGEVDRFARGNRGGYVVKDGENMLGLRLKGSGLQRLLPQTKSREDGAKMLKDCGVDVPRRVKLTDLAVEISKAVKAIDAELDKCFEGIEEKSAVFNNASALNSAALNELAIEEGMGQHYQQAYDPLEKGHAEATSRLAMLDALGISLKPEFENGVRIIERGYVAYDKGKGEWRVDVEARKSHDAKAGYAAAAEYLKECGIAVPALPSSGGPPRYAVATLASAVEARVNGLGTEIAGLKENMDALGKEWLDRAKPAEEASTDTESHVTGPASPHPMPARDVVPDKELAEPGGGMSSPMLAHTDGAERDRALEAHSLPTTARTPMTSSRSVESVGNGSGKTFKEQLIAGHARITGRSTQKSDGTISSVTGTSAAESGTHVSSSNGMSHQSGAATIGEVAGNKARESAQTSPKGFMHRTPDFFTRAFERARMDRVSQSRVGSDVALQPRVASLANDSKASSVDKSEMEIFMTAGSSEVLKYQSERDAQIDVERHFSAHARSGDEGATQLDGNPAAAQDFSTGKTHASSSEPVSRNEGGAEPARRLRRRQRFDTIRLDRNVNRGDVGSA